MPLADCVHIYSTNIDPDRSPVTRHESILSAAEKQRFRRFKFSRHAERWIRSRLALKRVLASHLDCEPVEVRLAAGINEKPYVKSKKLIVAPSTDPEALPRTVDAPLYFNLSHSGDQVVIAVSAVNEVGCDVERLKPMGDMDAVSRRFFSADEQQALSAVEPADRINAFYHAWTLKEALIKTTGEGLRATLNDFDVSLTPGHQAEILNHRDPTFASVNWHVYAFEPAPDYTAAVITTGSTAPHFLLEGSAIFDVPH